MICDCAGPEAVLAWMASVLGLGAAAYYVMTTYHPPPAQERRPMLSFPAACAIARDLAIVLAAIVYAIDHL